MNNIKKLLEGVEVEWKPLAYSEYGVAELSRGRVMSKEYLINNAGEYPVYSSQTANNGEIGKIRTFDYDGEYVTWTTDGANAGTVFHRTKKFSITNVCGLIRIKNTKVLNYKFLFYWLSIEAKKYVYSGMGNPKLMSNQIAKIPIPIPPLEIQQEIVRILDSFSMLTAELQAELQARKSQYEYYRNQLLAYPMEESDQSSLRSNRSATSIQNSDNSTQPLSTLNPHTGNSVLQPRGKVEWKMLGEIGTFIRGNGLQKKDFMENGVPCIHYGQIYTHYGTFATKTKSFVSKETANKCKKAHKGDLIIASTSENVEDVGKTVAWLGDDDVAISNHTFIYSHNQNPKYLAYLFQTQAFLKYKKTKVVGVKVIDIPQKALESFCIPIPPLEEQERIVSILDKFDTLTTSLTEGLPKEIELRQKQYEYYRNMLLSFPKNNIKA
ncbi:restriction endonuclease subunit S [Bacteroides stercoris]|mgnify:FL=1|jgi:type I restriction enzyme S subunit|uniref:restriction endonuclease subunit S n=1 Tax=Bacteroides stercoris TaxID=46506 RepID=UPI0022E6E077|nr:restriction endonuclease subunit S [Bacteroides stercoris]MDC2305839.1 restriction endonuclease subunit S [Bacteroides stercoris]